MRDGLTTADSTSSNEPTHGLNNETRKRWFELFLVLLVAFGGPLLNSIYLLVNGPGAMSQASNARWTLGILQEITALLLLGYVLLRRNLGFANLGLCISQERSLTGSDDGASSRRRSAGVFPSRARCGRSSLYCVSHRLSLRTRSLRFLKTLPR